MYTLTIEVKGKVHKQFERQHPINFSVWNYRNVQTWNDGNETCLLLDEKPSECIDLNAKGQSGHALIYIGSPRPTG